MMKTSKTKRQKKKISLISSKSEIVSAKSMTSRHAVDSGRVAIVADAHIGAKYVKLQADSVLVNLRAIDAFSLACNWALNNEIHTLIIAGDMFDTPMVSPRLVGILLNIIEVRSKQGLNMYFVMGNHDRFVNESALDYLPREHVSVFDTPGVFQIESGCRDTIIKMAVAPFVPGMAAKESILIALHQAQEEPEQLAPELLVGHFGVAFDESPPWVKEDPLYVDSRWMMRVAEKASVRLVVSGHDHSLGRYRTNYDDIDDDVPVRGIVPGALSPRSRGELGLKFGNIVEVSGLAGGCDPNIIVHKNAVPGVRFVKPHAFSEMYGMSSSFQSHWIMVSTPHGTDIKVPIWPAGWREPFFPESFIQTFGAVSVLEAARTNASGVEVFDGSKHKSKYRDVPSAISAYVDFAAGRDASLKREAIARTSDKAYAEIGFIAPEGTYDAFGRLWGEDA